jgi:ATP-dependent helicase HrpB
MPAPSTLSALPIDAVTAELVAAVRERGAAVLVAPPGAGKTTRIPGALLDAGLAGDGDVVVLQPRRIAARLAAARVADERRGVLGGEVGYEVRFDRKVGATTRIRFVTEGIVTRRLLSDPQLRGTGCVIIDEFHERHLDGDLALALVRRLRETTRPELRLVVMSATLDAEAVATYLGCNVVRSEGRTFPVSIEYADISAESTLGRSTATAVRTVLAKGLRGDLLVFLPGAREIRQVGGDLQAVAGQHQLDVVTLHGDLTLEEQARAVARGSRQKIILATNVAETSITVEGVVAVIDSGLARVARHSAWSGLPSLVTEPVSRASATQRAGRAGRTQPGVCIRLYSKHSYDSRREFDVPEILRSDLAPTLLELHAFGLGGAQAPPWFEPPPPAAVAAAQELLRRLGATDDKGMTELGRRMLRFPLHPRAARILCEAEDRGVAEDGSLLAALLGGRELRIGKRLGKAAVMASSSDLLDDLDLMLDARRSQLRSDWLRREGLDVATAHSVDKAARQLAGMCQAKRRGAGSASDDDLLIATLTGFPDRLGRRRSAHSREIVFARGGSATLAESSSVVGAELVVALDVSESGEKGLGTRTTIRRASRVEASWLLDLYLEQISESDELVWNSDKQRVERATRMSFDGLVFDEQVDPAGGKQHPAAAAAVLARQAVAAGLERFVDAEELAQWKHRLAFVAHHLPTSGVAAPTNDNLAAALGEACADLSSFAELKRLRLLDLLHAGLGPRAIVIDRFAPTHLSLGGKRRVAIHYEADRPPWIASRMQDFFGVARAPTVGEGRVPVVLHLLAPNQRPVQVTQDLPGFWIKHYPALRKQLMRRYPRHAWPEDPTAFLSEA